jgi:prevent-host-death family protein
MPLGKQSLKPTRTVAGMERWKLEDAKARFSEVVRQAAIAGPQLVTVRGKEAAVIIAPDQYEQLLPKSKDQAPLISFLKDLGLAGLDVEREYDAGRKIKL